MTQEELIKNYLETVNSIVSSNEKEKYINYQNKLWEITAELTEEGRDRLIGRLEEEFPDETWVYKDL